MGAETEVRLPDIGDFANVDVIEVLVSPGDRVQPEESLITLESDKATMEIPSPHAGLVKEVKVSVGDKLSEGDLILTMELGEGEPQHAAPARAEPEALEKAPAQPPPAAGATSAAEPAAQTAERLPGEPAPSPPPVPEAPAPSGAKAHASPSVRRFARELGVELVAVAGSGPKGRVLKEDVQDFVKQSLRVAAGAAPFALPQMPELDFSRFGEVESVPLSRIRKISGQNLHRNWVTVPHVTQFDEADITDLEAFRREQAGTAAEAGVKLTLLPFLIKASVEALRTFPQVNASLHPSGDYLIFKRYFHIGIAVDTPDGLVVPVIRDCEQKGLLALAAELAELSAKGRERRLSPGEMQGGCFTISSLGGIGGTGFTPIVNAPEVAILGVSRAVTRPLYREEGRLEPRLVLPLALSYDHRVVDGALAARFASHLRERLEDVRRLLL